MKRLMIVLVLAGCAPQTGLTKPDLAMRLPAKPATDCWADTGAGWIETPCKDDLTPEVTASLQRALAARGLFNDTPNGKFGPATTEAVRKYQAPLGYDSGDLTLGAARSLGVLPTPMGSLDPERDEARVTATADQQ